MSLKEAEKEYNANLEDIRLKSIELGNLTRKTNELYSNVIKSAVSEHGIVCAYIDDVFELELKGIKQEKSFLFVPKCGDSIDRNNVWCVSPLYDEFNDKYPYLKDMMYRRMSEEEAYKDRLEEIESSIEKCKNHSIGNVWGSIAHLQNLDDGEIKNHGPFGLSHCIFDCIILSAAE